MDDDNNNNDDSGDAPYDKNDIVIYCYNDFMLVKKYSKQCGLYTKIIYGDSILASNKVYEYYIN